MRDERRDSRNQVALEAKSCTRQDEGHCTRIAAGQTHEADKAKGEGPEDRDKDCLEKTQMKANDDGSVYQTENTNVSRTVEEEQAARTVRTLFWRQEHCFFFGIHAKTSYFISSSYKNIHYKENQLSPHDHGGSAGYPHRHGKRQGYSSPAQRCALRECPKHRT